MATDITEDEEAEVEEAEDLADSFAFSVEYDGGYEFEDYEPSPYNGDYSEE